MSYLPPTSPITCNFRSGGYSPESSPIVCDFTVSNEVAPYGVDFSAFGSSAATLLNQDITPSGFSGSIFGTLLAYPQLLIFPINNAFAAVGVARANIVVRFNFVDAYTPQPLPLLIDFFDGKPRPDGIDSAQFGGAVAYTRQFVTVSGSAHLGVGDIVTKYNRYFQIPGFDSSLFGVTAAVRHQYVLANGVTTPWDSYSQTRAYNFNQEVFVTYGFDGFRSTDFHVAQDARTYARPAGLFEQQVPVPFVSYEIRYLSPLPVQSTQFGAPIVDQQNRTVQPATFASTSFGVPYADFLTRSVAVSGIDGLTLPMHAVFDPAQYIHLPGVHQQSVPMPGASNRNIELRPPTIDAQEFGAHLAYNLWQIVRHEQIVRFDEVVGTTVYNKNFQLYPEGIDSLRMRPYHEARLSADAAPIEGFDALLFGPTVISNWIRNLEVPGEDHFGGSMHLVGNAAMAAYPSGPNLAAVGAHAALDGTVEVYVYLPAQDAYGTPAASLSPIIVTEVEGVSEARSGVPYASVSPLQISPVWDPDAITGWPMLEIRFRKVEPLAFPPPAPPAPTVLNRNREVRPHPAYGEVGAHRAVRMLQHIGATGIDDRYFGSALARDRTSYIRPFGIIPESGSGPVVLKYPPDPPPPRVIYAPSVDGAVSVPVVMSFTIRPSGVESSDVPEPTATSNTVVVPSVVEDLTADTMHFIPAPSFVAVLPTPDQESHGKPSCSPYTVWATRSVPAQAVANHWGVIYHVVDDPEVWAAAAPGVGRPDASLRNRRILPFGTAHSSVSDPYVAQRLQIVRPTGINSGRVMAPTIPNPGPVRAIGISDSQVGDPVAYFPAGFVQQVMPLGVVGEIGQPVISNYMREIPVSGLIHSAFGQTSANHELPPFNIAGLDALAVGSHDVGHRIRSFQIHGFETTGFGPEAGEFVRRLRVVRLDRVRPAWAPVSQFGYPEITYGVRHIRATDISPPPVMPPRIQHAVAAGGLSGHIIGHQRVDAEIEGSVLAYGIDAHGVGRPASAFMAYMSGLAGTIGDARPANAIGVAGVSEEFGAASAVGGPGHTCGMLPRAVAGGALETAGVGEPSLV